MSKLDGQTKELRLFDEIREILINLPEGTPITVFLPLEGPVTYSYMASGKLIRGIFEGDYTKQDVKTLVSHVKNGLYSFIYVKSKGLYSYNFTVSYV